MSKKEKILKMISEIELENVIDYLYVLTKDAHAVAMAVLETTSATKKGA